MSPRSTRSRLAPWLATAVAAVVLAGCSSSSTSGGGASTTASGSTAAPASSSSAGSASGSADGSAVSSAPASQPTGGGAPITLLSSGDADTSTGQGKALTDLLTQFSSTSGVQASLERVPFDQYLASATTKARAGSLADVVELLPGANFESLFPALTDFTKADVQDADAVTGWEAAVKEVGQNDVYAGAPIGAQGVVWYYNKALFEQAGLDPAAPPKTWGELKDAATKLKAAGIDPVGMSGSDGFLLWWAWSSLSPQFFSADDVNAVRSGAIPLTDARFADSLAPLKELYDEGLVATDFAGKKFTDVEADFAAGKVAIVPGIISNAMNWKVWDDKLGKDAYGVFTAPKVDGTTLSGQFFNPVLVYGVSAKSANPEAAKALINAMVSKEGQTTLLKEASQFPNRTDVDVAGTTGSTGAGDILDIVEAVGGVDVAQNQFNAAAQSASWTNLTGAMESGDITGFLEDLENQQRG